MKMKRGFIGCLLSIFVILTMFSGCNVGSTDGGEADTVLGGGSSVLRIVSGSENSELEPILEEFSDREHVRIEMTYMGSLDIMRLLGEEDIPYDAVWPASSLWLTVGDTEHRIKHGIHLHFAGGVRYPQKPGGGAGICGAGGVGKRPS